MCAVFLLAAASQAAAQESVLGIPCVPEEGGVRFCQGSIATRVPTWDGVPLDVDIWLPPAEYKAPNPLIVAIHGFGATKAGAWNNPRNAVAFARKGYIAMSYSARGQGASCGTPASRTPPECDRGWVHLADARYEGRDTQYLAGLLVDAGLARPGIGVTGSSYGGGQSLMLAALRNRTMLPDGRLERWRSPKGTPMEIAAAAPKIGWSDLAYALVPTGRTLDYRSLNPYGERFGVAKGSYLEGLFLVGESGYYAPEGADPEADIRTWKKFVSAGEPYDERLAGEIRRQFTRFRSAYYAPREERVTPAPTVIWNAVTDDIMPPGEALRYMNLVRREFPGASIGVIMGDGFAHPRGSLAAGAPLHDAERETLFDRYLKGNESAKPLNGVITTTQACNGGQVLGPFRTATWREQHPGAVVVRDAAAQRFDSAGGSADNALQTDPFGGGGACRTVGAARDPGAATYESVAAPASGLTLIGSPTITARLRIEGDAPQITARVWDVSPSGEQTLVQHGSYRPEGSGVQTFQVHPAAWYFAPGHKAKLELLGRDSPYAQASTGTFAITVEDLVLELPVREPPDGALIERYAPAQLAVAFSMSRRQRIGRNRALRLRAGCPREDCSATIAALVIRSRGVRRMALPGRVVRLAAGDVANLRVRVPPRVRRALRGARRGGAKPRLRVVATVTDDAGNSVRRTARVRVTG